MGTTTPTNTPYAWRVWYSNGTDAWGLVGAAVPTNPATGGVIVVREYFVERNPLPPFVRLGGVIMGTDNYVYLPATNQWLGSDLKPAQIRTQYGADAVIRQGSLVSNQAFDSIVAQAMAADWLPGEQPA